MSKVFIFIGRSGCGKGTQAELLLKELRAKEPATPALYLETGKYLREFTATPNFTAGLTKEVMARGARVPDWLAVWSWSQMLINQFTGRENLVMDGSPRSLLEAQMMTTVWRSYQGIKPTVIHLAISNESARARLTLRGRHDDQNVEDVNRRLAWFDVDVMPAVEFLKASPVYQFAEVSGEPTVEEIRQDILKLL